MGHYDDYFEQDAKARKERLEKDARNALIQMFEEKFGTFTYKENLYLKDVLENLQDRMAFDRVIKAISNK